MVAAKPITVPPKWRKLFKLLPGYDPMCMRQPGDWFDADAADHVCAYYPAMLKHVEGVKGTPSGSPFHLSPWQQAVFGCLFGFKNADNLRCYREVFVYVPKKNGKTAWFAGLIPYLLSDKTMVENGRRLFSAASAFDQASIIFDHAKGMVTQNPAIKRALKVIGASAGAMKRSIVNERRMSSYRCLASNADAVDGAQPDFLFIDEIHRHDNDDLIDVLIEGTGARAEPITIYATTADYNRPSPCNDMLKRARLVRDNGGDPQKQGHESSFLPVIYEAMKDDDWEDEKVWAEANPNMGVTKTVEFMRTRCKQAKEIPSKLNTFLRLHLNIVTDADVAFFDMSQWDACGGELGLAELRGQPCFGGIDLASTKDVSAFVLYFPLQKAVLCWFFLPEVTAVDREKKDSVPYTAWAREGLIDVQKGRRTCDYDVIRKCVNDVHKLYDIRQVAFDMWNSKQLQEDLDKDGFDVIQFGQGMRSMTAPTKELERMVIEGELRHGGNAVLRWMAGNMMAKEDEAENVKPDKKRSTEKIDGIVALIMAIGISMVAPAAGVSCYESEELTVL